MKNVIIQIPDMQSAHCQMRVNKAISAVEGVVIENIQPGEAAVSLREDAQQQEVFAAIQKAGYTVAGVAPGQEAVHEDETFTFKTNIHCGGCVEKVRPALDSTPGICHWDIDTNSRDKILSVHSEGVTRQEIIDIVHQTGFEIEIINA